MTLNSPLPATICLSIVTTTGIVCNIFAITLLYMRKGKKSLKEKIVTVLCGINLIQTIGYILELQFLVSHKMISSICEVEAFIICFSTYTIIGYICALILERYMAIVHPFLYSTLIIKKLVIVLCLILPFLYGLGFGVAPVLGWGKYGRSRPNSLYCAFDFRDRSLRAKSFFFTAILFCFVIPLLIAFVSYRAILRELRSTAQKFTKSFGKAAVISKDSNKRTQENYISSILTGLVYLLSWVPYGIVCFLFYYEKYVPSNLEYFAIFMSKSATTTSPVIFCLMEKRVRRFIKREKSINWEISPIIKSSISSRGDGSIILPNDV